MSTFELHDSTYLFHVVHKTRCIRNQISRIYIRISQVCKSITISFLGKVYKKTFLPLLLSSEAVHFIVGFVWSVIIVKVCASQNFSRSMIVNHHKITLVYLNIVKRYNSIPIYSLYILVTSQGKNLQGSIRSSPYLEHILLDCASLFTLTLTPENPSKTPSNFINYPK